MSKNTGGSAFPGIEKQVFDHGPSREPTVVEEPTPGMSLRDYFAAHAMSGWLASCSHVKWEEAMLNESADNTASLAFRFADAMLAERDKDAAS